MFVPRNVMEPYGFIIVPFVPAAYFEGPLMIWTHLVAVYRCDVHFDLHRWVVHKATLR